MDIKDMKIKAVKRIKKEIELQGKNWPGAIQKEKQTVYA